MVLNLGPTYGILKPVWKPQPNSSATSSCGYNWRHFHSSLTLIVVRPSSLISSTFAVNPSPNGKETWVGGGWTNGLAPIIRSCCWGTECLHPFITRCLPPHLVSLREPGISRTNGAEVNCCAIWLWLSAKPGSTTVADCWTDSSCSRLCSPYRYLPYFRLDGVGLPARFHWRQGIPNFKTNNRKWLQIIWINIINIFVIRIENVISSLEF